MKSEARQVRREAMLNHKKIWAGRGKSSFGFFQEAGQALSVFTYWHSIFGNEHQSAPSQFVALCHDDEIWEESGLVLYYPSGVRLAWRGRIFLWVIKMLFSWYYVHVRYWLILTAFFLYWHSRYAKMIWCLMQYSERATRRNPLSSEAFIFINPRRYQI